MDFVSAITKETNKTLTTNGATAFKSTGDDLVDAFASLGAMRTATVLQIEDKFIRAFADDKLLATKLAFYMRNIRGLGNGERRIFRVIFKYIGNNYPEIAIKNLDNVAVFGRFDDLFCLFGTKSEKEMIKYVCKVFKEDMKLLKNKFSNTEKSWLIESILKKMK